jgi:hypothetical protein
MPQIIPPKAGRVAGFNEWRRPPHKFSSDAVCVMRSKCCSTCFRRISAVPKGNRGLLNLALVRQADLILTLSSCKNRRFGVRLLYATSPTYSEIRLKPSSATMAPAAWKDKLAPASSSHRATLTSAMAPASCPYCLRAEQAGEHNEVEGLQYER